MAIQAIAKAHRSMALVTYLVKKSQWNNFKDKNYFLRQHVLSNAWIQRHMWQPVEPWFISSWSSEIKGSFWYLNISARWGHLDQQMKHKHKPGSLEYQSGYSAYHNPHLQMEILCYFSFYSVTWSPVETHSHCSVGKGGTGPYWDEKATIKMNIKFHAMDLSLRYLKLGK